MINTTNFTNQSGNFIIGIGNAINTESSGLWGMMILIGFYIVIFSASVRYGIKTAFATATFVGVVIASLLRGLAWINDTVMYLSIVLGIIGLIILKVGE
jgi:hypothetical protein